jgi:hypothetical protein
MHSQRLGEKQVDFVVQTSSSKEQRTRIVKLINSVQKTDKILFFNCLSFLFKIKNLQNLFQPDLLRNLKFDFLNFSKGMQHV